MRFSRSPWDEPYPVGDVAYRHGKDTERLMEEVDDLVAQGWRIHGAYIVRESHGDERHVVLIKPAKGEHKEQD